MKRITVVETRNGFLVVDGEAESYETSRTLAKKSWSYNSLDAAIAQIRRVLKSWREAAEAEGNQ